MSNRLDYGTDWYTNLIQIKVHVPVLLLQVIIWLIVIGRFERRAVRYPSLWSVSVVDPVNASVIGPVAAPSATLNGCPSKCLSKFLSKCVSPTESRSERLAIWIK